MSKDRIRKYRPNIHVNDVRKSLRPERQEELDAFAESIGLDGLFETMRDEGVLTKDGHDEFMDSQGKSSEDNIWGVEFPNLKTGLSGAIVQTLVLGDLVRKSKSDKGALRKVVEERTKEFPRGCNLAASLYFRWSLWRRK